MYLTRLHFFFRTIIMLKSGATLIPGGNTIIKQWFYRKVTDKGGGGHICIIVQAFSSSFLYLRLMQ